MHEDVVRNALASLDRSTPPTRDIAPPIQAPVVLKAGHADGPSELASAEDFSLRWLLHKVPVKAWVWLAGLLAAAFLVGLNAARLPIVGELFGGHTSGPVISDVELRNRLDQLVSGHNASTARLYDEIANQERAAGASTYTLDRTPHVEAADRLRDAVAREDSLFRSQVNALKALAK